MQTADPVLQIDWKEMPHVICAYLSLERQCTACQNGFKKINVRKMGREKSKAEENKIISVNEIYLIFIHLAHIPFVCRLYVL